jgi:hypothetical protein
LFKDQASFKAGFFMRQVHSTIQFRKHKSMVQISSRILQEFKTLLKLHFKLSARSKNPLCMLQVSKQQLFLWGTDGESIIMWQADIAAENFRCPFSYAMLGLVETALDVP